MCVHVCVSYRFDGSQFWQRVGSVSQHDNEDGRPGVWWRRIQTHVHPSALCRAGLHAALLSHIQEELGTVFQYVYLLYFDSNTYNHTCIHAYMP